MTDGSDNALDTHDHSRGVIIRPRQWPPAALRAGRAEIAADKALGLRCAADAAGTRRRCDPLLHRTSLVALSGPPEWADSGFDPTGLRLANMSY
jgi:hypothetical protein